MAYSNFENRNKKTERKSYNGFNKKPFNKTFEKRPTNVTKSFALAFSDYYSEKICELVDLMAEIPFDKISIPVTIPKAVVFNNNEAKGFVNAGYINSFSMAEGFKVTVLAKYVDKISDDYTISVRIRTDKDSNPIMITGFSFSDADAVDFAMDDFDEEVSDEVSDNDTTEVASDEEVVDDVTEE